MPDITIQIQFYGAFRKFGASQNITLASGSNVTQVKQALSETLGALVHDSVLANDNAVLPNSYVFEEDAILCILPPVCGG